MQSYDLLKGGPSLLARGVAALCAALIVAAPGGSASAAPPEIVLHAFCSQLSPNFTCPDGARPGGAGVVADSKSNLYGTAIFGGGGTGCFGAGCGVIFQLSLRGHLYKVHSFNVATPMA